MTALTNEYKLASFKKIEPLNEKDNLWIVVDSVTGSRFVMRKLSAESLKIYEILKTICHPNIVEVTDVFLHNDFLYVIEEYLEGDLISEAAAAKSFSKRRIFSIGKQLLGALSVLHEHNIIHRDIKPDNIMIDKRGNVKLIDFDIARVFLEEKNKDTVAKGSRNYAPPEQYGFSQSNRQTDIYALGITLNELATGTFPDKKICTGRLGRVVRRCIEFDPARRYRTAEQALKHMKRLEKRKILLPAGVVVFLAAAGFLMTAKELFHPPVKSSEHTNPSEDSEPSGGDESFQDTNSLDDAGMSKYEELLNDRPGTVNYDDRIIRGRNSQNLPYIMLKEDGDRYFEIDEEKESPIAVQTEKKDKKLNLTCSFKDGTEKKFEFDDVYPEDLAGDGDAKEPVPEYEILIDDFNKDGVTDLCIAYSCRQLYKTIEEEYSYYQVNHSILWMVYSNGQNSMSCSGALSFGSGLPVHEEGAGFSNPDSNEWFYFEDGEWKVF